jgi:pimeloyl-ACP methyl ester carboxylesterase
VAKGLYHRAPSCALDLTQQNRNELKGRPDAALSDEPAFVFGSSIGAVIGLELAASYGLHVRILIAHESPVLGLLDCTEREELLSHTDVLETVRHVGIPAAMKLMAARSEVDTNLRRTRTRPIASIAPVFQRQHSQPIQK